MTLPPPGKGARAGTSSCQALLEGTLWAEWALEAEKTRDQELQVLVLEVGVHRSGEGAEQSGSRGICCADSKGDRSRFWGLESLFRALCGCSFEMGSAGLG